MTDAPGEDAIDGMKIDRAGTFTSLGREVCGSFHRKASTSGQLFRRSIRTILRGAMTMGRRSTSAPKVDSIECD